MSAENETMIAKLAKDCIVIELPLDLLKWAEENREYDPLKIHNKKKMAEWIADNILNWGGNQDTGSTAWEDFIDAMFISALEDGEEWLDADWEDE